MTVNDDRDANAVAGPSSPSSSQRGSFTSPSRRRSSSGGPRASQPRTSDRTYAHSASTSSVSVTPASPRVQKDRSRADSASKKQPAVVEEDVQTKLTVTHDDRPLSSRSQSAAVSSASATSSLPGFSAPRARISSSQSVPIEGVDDTENMQVEFAEQGNRLWDGRQRDVTRTETRSIPTNDAYLIPTEARPPPSVYSADDESSSTSTEMLVDSPPQLPQENMLQIASDPRAGWPDPKRLELRGHGWLSAALVGMQGPSDLSLGSIIGWIDPKIPYYDLEKRLVTFDINGDFKDFHKTKQPLSPLAAALADQSKSSDSATQLSKSRPFSYSSAVSTTAHSNQHPQVQQALPAGPPPVDDSARYVQAPKQPFLRTAAELTDHRPHPNAMYDVFKQEWHTLCVMPGNATGFIPEVHKCRGTYPSHFYIPLEGVVDPKFVLRPSQVQVAQLDGMGGPSALSLPDPTDPSDQCWSAQGSLPTQRWNLFVCDGCRHAVASSSHRNACPGVLQGLWQPFEDARREELTRQHADSGEDRPTFLQYQASFQLSQEYLWKVLRNLLYQAERQAIPSSGTTYIRRMGKSLAALNLFLRLGFTKSTLEGKEILNAPVMTHTTCLVLARAFLEVSLCIAKSDSDLRAAGHDTGQPPAAQLIKLSSPRDVLSAHFGRSRSAAPAAGQWLFDAAATRQTAKMLGCLPETTTEAVIFAYGTQVSSDPSHAPMYYDALQALRQQRTGDEGNDLDVVIATEQSRGRLGYAELARRLQQIGFTTTDIHANSRFFGVVELRNLSEEHIARQYQTIIATIVATLQEGNEEDVVKRVSAVNEAIRALIRTMPQAELLEAMVTSSEERTRLPSFTVPEAYKRIGCPEDIDEATLYTFAEFFLNDADASELPKLRAALQTIVNDRNSALLNQLLHPEAQIEATDAAALTAAASNKPPGLVNIGNTCYLNSLLQYLFTIVPLRQIITTADDTGSTVTNSQLIKLKRIGGRQITLRELERSKRFVSELSQLFTTLATSTAPAVRPTKDLAYLALVSSKDEEDEAQPVESVAQDDSHGHNAAVPLTAITSITDSASASQVDRASKHADAEMDQQAKSPSVLGKRNSDHLLPDNAEPSDASRESIPPTDVDEQMSLAKNLARSLASDNHMMAQEAPDGVVEILPANDERAGKISSQAPPLPPRPTPRKNSALVNPNMMFGKQNDVAEAMDNVIFQLEVGTSNRMLPADDTTASSPIQHLFKGVSRQSLRLAGQSTEVRHKEEHFSYLLIDIPHDGLDIYDGIDAAFSQSTVTLDDNEVERTDSLLRLPPILQIQLQRVQFDKATSRVYKSNAFMGVPDTLLMHRFMADDAQADSERRERTQALAKDLRDAQQALRERLVVNDDRQTTAGILREAVENLQQLHEVSADPIISEQFRSAYTSLAHDDSVELPLHAVLTDLASHLDDEVAALKVNIDKLRQDIAELWPNDSPDYEYELVSVFMHSGGAGSGHYYLYQKALPESNTRWLKINDATVTDVSAAEVLANTSGQAANPYWLAYVRKSHIAEYIEAVRAAPSTDIERFPDVTAA